jgi:(E)-4-hydroxy-3-methylbut-2-enyl-diphosphate synthase
MDLFNYQRRVSSEVQVGNTPLGGKNPIRIQSMTTTSTDDTEGSVAQAKRIIDAGGEYVRLTTQGVKEAENLKNINAGLRKDGYMTPLVADVHFNPHVADVAALYAEKVRINPGNYVDPARTFKQLEYTDEEYAAELKKIEARFVPFLQICKENHTAVRIGVNHGSLSDRIMSRYGDTPEGIVESCMEFLRICKREQFNDVVISIKASNTVVMVRSVRLLVHAMDAEDMHYPLHLGVTEAGEGEDGRIKSAVGIGALLADGIGDTIRVSLTEEPEAEIPVARHLVDYITGKAANLEISQKPAEAFDYLHPEQRKTHAVGRIGGGQSPVVIGSDDINPRDYHFLQLPLPLANDEFLQNLKKHPEIVVVTVGNTVGEHRAIIHRLMTAGITNPAVISYSYHHSQAEKDDFLLEAAADMGALLIDGLCDGIWLVNQGDLSAADIIATSFGILQAARLRTTKTEYISCPGCGRTLYDLRATIARIKEATKDMTGLKIGIMGCIVNGPGEMADADYGYVGAGRGKISLYRRKECVLKNIPEEEAVDRLLALIHEDQAKTAE